MVWVPPNPDCPEPTHMVFDFIQIDYFHIVIGPDGRLSLEPLRKLDRSALANDLRQLQATMPLTPSVIEECRSGERW